MKPLFSLNNSSFINNFKITSVLKYNLLKIKKKTINILEVISINLDIKN